MPSRVRRSVVGTASADPDAHVTVLLKLDRSALEAALGPLKELQKVWRVGVLRQVPVLKARERAHPAELV